MLRMVLEKTLRYIALAGIFALPFIVFIIAQSLFFPFITGKNFAFRIIVEVMAGAWLALALINPAYRPRRLWLLAAFATFVIVIALADAFGVNPSKSFWSNFERMDGWITLAHLFLYFVVASVVLNTEKLWRSFFQTSLAISAIVGVYAFLQLFGIASLNPGFSSAARLDATFGNPIYLAAYMLFHVFLAALLLAQLWQKGYFRTYTPLVFLYGGVFVLDTIILFLTGTRGAILGLVGGTILATLLFILRGRDSGRARQVATGIVVFILVLAGGLYLARDQSWVKDAPILSRLATISLSESTARARMMNWGTAWKGVLERPILGWGQENFAIVFNKYYDPHMYAQEQWFDRVHNVVFDWLVAGGALGLLTYLSLFVFALRYIWRRGTSSTSLPAAQARAQAGSFSLPEQSILTGLLAAYFFHNLFVFDNIMSYVLFVSVLAFIAFRTGEATNASRLFPLPLIPARAFPIVIAVAIVAVWGAAWFVNAKPLAANRALLQALAPHSEGIAENLEYFEKAVSYNSFGTQEAREQLVQATAQLARVAEIPIETKQKFVEAAVREMTLQAESSPLDPRFPLFLGSLLNTYGFYAESEKVLARTRLLSPTKQTILFEVAANALARGDTELALQVFKEAFELAPEFHDARIYYAAAAIRAEQDKLADEILAPLIPSGSAADVRIAASYVARKRYDKIIVIWEAYLKVHPENTQGYFTLAASYYAAGSSQKAIAQLEKAAEIDPSLEDQVKTLIQGIRDGTTPR